MFDPFDYWKRAVAANVSLADSTVRWGETVAASATVIRVRTDIIAAGMRSPFEADYRELSAMIPEKIAAFGKSGSAAATELQSTRSGYIGSWQKPATTFDISGILTPWTRMATLGLETLELTARLAEVALKPVHRAATANARRLG